jgi:hypothetical protein
MVDKVQPSPLIRAEVWCVFSETKFIKCALAFFGPDLNGNEVLIAELVGTQDFRGNSGHFYLGEYILPSFVFLFSGLEAKQTSSPLKRTRAQGMTLE